MHTHVASDRKKKVKITLVEADFNEIKMEHNLNHTHSTMFKFGLKFRKEDDDKVSIVSVIHSMACDSK